MAYNLNELKKGPSKGGQMVANDLKITIIGIMAIIITNYDFGVFLM